MVNAVFRSSYLVCVSLVMESFRLRQLGEILSFPSFLPVYLQRFYTTFYCRRLLDGDYTRERHLDGFGGHFVGSLFGVVVAWRVAWFRGFWRGRGVATSNPAFIPAASMLGTIRRR